MKKAIMDYIVFAALLIMLLAMVGSALMLIRTMSIKWFFNTATVTIVAMVGTILSQMYDEREDKEP